MLTSRKRLSSSRWAVGLVGASLTVLGAACGSATNTIDEDTGPTGIDTGVILPGVDAGPMGRTCVAFLDGFIFGHGWAAWREQGDMYYCPPPDFSASAAVPVVVEYLRAHPDRADAHAHVLVFAALNAAYPCTPAGAPK